MIQNEPMEVGTRGRLYTSVRHRRRMDVTANSNVDLQVKVRVLDRDPDWGLTSKTVVFEATMRTYGVVAIPDEARDFLGVETGDHVRVSMGTVDRVDAQATQSVAEPKA